MYDVAVIGGGIIGTSAAAYLAEAGASVVLYERSAIGAGASGRNSGAIQHPYDHAFARLHEASLPLYRELAAMDPDFTLRPDPDGLLLVTPDAEAAAATAADLQATTPELGARFVSSEELLELEPAIAHGIAAVWLDTGYAVAPASATQAFARRAQRAGVDLRVGVWASLASARADASNVLVAAGPWSVDLIPGWHTRAPISRGWGVVVTVNLAQPPRRVLEELSIDASGSDEPVAFSLMTADGATSLGSTFLADEPDPTAMVGPLRERGRAYLPALADATVVGVRVCARPVSYDGRPLIGPVAGEERVFVCAGHGPWGISTGPASGRLVADVILGRAVVPAELAAGRYQP